VVRRSTQEGAEHEECPWQGGGDGGSQEHRGDDEAEKAAVRQSLCRRRLWIVAGDGDRGALQCQRVEGKVRRLRIEAITDEKRRSPKEGKGGGGNQKPTSSSPPTNE
jgi:hypothetical protein